MNNAGICDNPYYFSCYSTTCVDYMPWTTLNGWAQPPIPQTITETTTAIQELLTSGEITSVATATSLTSVLDSALTAEQQGNEQAADQILEGFIKQVEGQARAGKITQDAADLLIEAARLQIAK